MSAYPNRRYDSFHRLVRVEEIKDVEIAPEQ